MARKRKKSKGLDLGSFFRSVFSVFMVVAKYSFPVIAVVGLFFAVGVGLKNYLYADSNFIITNVKISTDLPYPKQDVLVRGKIKEGTNVLSADLAGIAERLYEDARIKTVTVRRVFPNTLAIDMTIREAYAYVLLTSKTYLLDREGYVIARMHEGDSSATLPTIDDNSHQKRSLKVGERYYPGTIENTYFVIEYLKKTQVVSLDDIDRIAVDRLNSLSIYMKEGYALKLGHTRLLDNLEKLQHIPKVLENENQSRIKYIDLRFDDIIVKK